MSAASRDAARREARVEEGRRQRQREAAACPSLPSQGQLMLPLLRALDAAGGRATPRQVYAHVAEQIGLPDDAAQSLVSFQDGSAARAWWRKVRWARQTAVARGYVASAGRGLWELAAPGRNALQNVRPGIVITLFETARGIAFAAQAEEGSALIEPGSIDLILTSPPFPILTGKSYGTMDTASWLEWMTGLAAQWRDLLDPEGSMIIHLGPARYRGAPVHSPYVERFLLRLIDEVGLHLAGRLYWQNPARLPDLQWAAIRRVRVRDDIEPLLWLSRSEHCRADNRRILEPYSQDMRNRYLGRDIDPVERPGGINLGSGSFRKDNGGRIPGSLVRSVNAPPRDGYCRSCRKAGLPLHPARMPARVAEYAIGLTTEPDDLVYDPFFGSGTTGAVAEQMGRRWIGTERSLRYLQGARFRFDRLEGYRRHLVLPDPAQEEKSCG